MASADQGDDSKVRIGPYVPDVTQSEPLDPAAPNAVTQLMPLVPTADTPVVRAVARRPPTALPALGGADGPRDAPPSAREAVSRKRQAAADLIADPAVVAHPAPPVADPAVDASDAALDIAGPGLDIADPGLDAADPALDVADPGLDAADPAAAIADAAPAGPEVESGMDDSGAAEPEIVVAEPSQATAGDSDDDPVDRPLWRLPAQARPEPARPTALPVRPNAPVQRSGQRTPVAEIAVAEFMEDGEEARAQHRRAAAATFVDGPGSSGGARRGETALLTQVADRPFGADDWLPSDPAATIPEPARLLPGKLAADSWDTTAETPMVNEDYLGGRRRPSALSPRILVTIFLVLLGLGAAVAVPFFVSAPDTPTQGRPPGEDNLIGAADSPAVGAGELISAASSPGAQPTTRPAPPTTKRPTSDFEPLTLITASVGSYASWQKTDDSVCHNGSVILTGRWQSPPGTLTLSNIKVPKTGDYFMTITYGDNPTGGNRTAEIRVNDANVNGPGFQPGCRTTGKIRINFNRTSGNKITFGNQNSIGPSISKVVISAS